MEWFRHDSNANLDEKLQEVLLDYGLEGYGLYWYCIELIVGKTSADNITFELKHDARIIARNTGASVKRVEEMMKRFVSVGLFENRDGKITCLKVAKRLMSSATSNHKMRSMIQDIRKSHDDVMMESNFVMQEEKRIEEKRIEEKEEIKKEKKEIHFFSEIDESILSQWKAVRKKKGGAAFSDIVYNAMVRESKKAGITLEQAIIVCVERNWITFNADWYVSSAKSNGNKFIQKDNDLAEYNRKTKEAVKAKLFGLSEEKDITNDSTRL